ncbi:hypothetical protein FRC10_006047 [Ceratobasidium sp. 414]|nr:hypothetical protein FRC10_006047 [Ceratobasidium sp. 414]
MAFSATVRAAAGPPRLRSALQSILYYLKFNNIGSAGKTLRLLVDAHPVPRSALTASQVETSGGQAPALSIAALGARISLARNEIESAVEFTTLLQAYADKTSSPSPTIAHVVSGLAEIASRESLSHAANILCSMSLESITHELVETFYKYSANHANLIAKVWAHTHPHRFPAPRGEALVALLKKLSRDEEFGPVISLITAILRDNTPGAQSLPPEIPIELAPQVITFAVRAGATRQSVQLWNLARQQIGDPQTPASLPQAQFFGDPGMTYALVRHFIKLSEKKTGQLQKWHTVLLEDDSNYFLQMAEQFYEAFATVHGFNHAQQDAYMRADHYHVSTSVACLFALNQFMPAIDVLETLFRRNELLDNKDFGIILAALARRNAGRACQILLEAAPARMPGFAPTPYLYNIVLHHSLLQGRENEALRIMFHARDAGCGSLEPKSLDTALRSALKDIEASWEADRDQESANPSRIERSHLFKRVIEVLNIAQHHARSSTVRKAIETALLVRQPIIAWDIWMLGKKYRRIGNLRVRPGGAVGQQKDFGRASAWRVAKGLWSAKERGRLGEQKMWGMIEAIGIKVPKEARGSIEWEKAAQEVQQKEGEILALPASLRRGAGLDS